MSDKLFVIDAHAHFLPKATIPKAIEMKIDPSKMSVAPIYLTLKKMENLELILQNMQEAGVDMTLLMQTVWTSLGLEICKVINDEYSKVKKAYPGKFIMCGHIPLKSGQEVINEIDRCLTQLGLDAITLATYSPEFTFDAKELRPIYNKINSLGVPIVFHPLMANRWDATGKYEIRSTVMREYEISKCLIEVMCGVLPSLPELKLLFPHYGGGMPGLKARIKAFYEPEGWPVPEAEVKYNGKSPRELEELGLAKSFDELFNKVYFDMAGAGAGSMEMLNAGLATLRTDRTCFGTDYPFDLRTSKDLKYFIDNIKKLNVSDSEKALMLGGNTKRLFGIK